MPCGNILIDKELDDFIVKEIFDESYPRTEYNGSVRSDYTLPGMIHELTSEKNFLRKKSSFIVESASLPKGGGTNRNYIKISSVTSLNEQDSHQTKSNVHHTRILSSPLDLYTLSPDHESTTNTDIPAISKTTKSPQNNNPLDNHHQGESSEETRFHKNLFITAEIMQHRGIDIASTPNNGDNGVEPDLSSDEFIIIDMLPDEKKAEILEGECKEIVVEKKQELASSSVPPAKPNNGISKNKKSSKSQPTAFFSKLNRKTFSVSSDLYKKVPEIRSSMKTSVSPQKKLPSKPTTTRKLKDNSFENLKVPANTPYKNPFKKNIDNTPIQHPAKPKIPHPKPTLSIHCQDIHLSIPNPAARPDPTNALTSLLDPLPAGKNKGTAIPSGPIPSGPCRYSLTSGGGHKPIGKAKVNREIGKSGHYHLQKPRYKGINAGSMNLLNPYLGKEGSSDRVFVERPTLGKKCLSSNYGQVRSGGVGGVDTLLGARSISQTISSGSVYFSHRNSSPQFCPPAVHSNNNISSLIIENINIQTGGNNLDRRGYKKTQRSTIRDNIFIKHDNNMRAHKH